MTQPRFIREPDVLKVVNRLTDRFKLCVTVETDLGDDSVLDALGRSLVSLDSKQVSESKGFAECLSYYHAQVTESLMALVSSGTLTTTLEDTTTGTSLTSTLHFTESN